MKLRLVTPAEFETLPDGTELGCIDGKKYIKGKDHMDDDTRGGYMAFGHILPDDSKGCHWDTSKSFKHE